MNTSTLWALAGELDIIPQPPNKIVARQLSKWWERPRKFGCISAKSGLWFVLPPDARIWCHRCALRRLEEEHRCIYCHHETDPLLDRNYVFEMSKITVLGQAHLECEMEAEEK